MKSQAYKAIRPFINLAKPQAKHSLLKVFQGMAPKVSPTEKQVLGIGDVGVEGEIYAGKIDWNRFLNREKHDLTAEEQAYLDGPVEEFCRMIDDYALYQGAEQDMSRECWDFAKKNGMLGMGIPKKWGGLGFSEYAHSCVIEKICSRSLPAAVSVMVPNSLGPAAVILHYGTDAQKEKYLSKLAKGELLPCFALTEPEAGSDATNVQSTGEIRADENGEPYIHVTHLDKRYSTLAPIADLPGLALSLKDPDNLLGKGEDLGLTLVVVEKETPGLIKGNRHNPAGVPFQNGTIRVAEEGMKLSIEDNVVGGEAGIGNGWIMLVTLLSVGRGISLPSLSTAGMKTAVMAASAYGAVRQQFGMPIGQFKGVKKIIGDMAGLTYVSEAMKRSTLRTIDSGMIPSVATAMVKYHLTEHMRKTVIDGMDILGGKAVMKGRGNPLDRTYQAQPIAITVEGANIMTRNFMIFGQGSLQAHPYLQDEVNAMENPDQEQGANDLWDLVINKHTSNLLDNADKAKTLGKKKPVASLKGYKQQIQRLSSAFNVAANLSAITIADRLKSEETLGARMGDMMSYLYMATAAIEKFYDDGQPDADRPLMEWACEWALFKAEEALAEFIPNYQEYYSQYEQAMKERGKGIPFIRKALNLATPIEDTLPKGPVLSKPSDALSMRVADTVLNPGEPRDRLTKGVYLSSEPDDALSELEVAFEKVHQAAPLEAAIKKAMRDGTLQSALPEEAFAAGIIDAYDIQIIDDARTQSAKVVKVDEYPPEAFRP